MLRIISSTLCAGILLTSCASAQSGGPQSGLQYGENWLVVQKDSDIVARAFPKVNITLHAPAFSKPETVPARFANGSEGPADEIDHDYFIRSLARKNSWLSYETADFLSEEGRAIPYLYLSTPGKGEEKKLRVYIQAAIHGNEPAADQSVLALLGKMDAEPSWAESILEKMDIKVLPRYNVDGIAYFQRQLAYNLDRNRDHIKLARKQSRNIKRVVTHINPNIHPDIVDQVLKKFIPAMGDALKEYGLRWEPYVTNGASDDDPDDAVVLEEAVTEARTGRNAIGLTQTISFLLEMRGIRLADQHFHRRVATALVKIHTILETARDDFDSVLSTVEDARQDFIESDEEIIVTDSYVRETRNFTLIDINNGSVVHPQIDFIRTTPSEANLTRARPEAYIIPRPWFDVANKLENLGLEVERLEHGFNGTVETLIIETSRVTPSQYEGTYLNTVTTTARERDVVLPPGSFRVSTRQKNAALAFIALEPENIDSYVTFNIIQVDQGEEYPVFRVPSEK
ncbi:uncharacterized protein F5Z01DRAFT_750091 [Emericellopsis atlantica]|uniref:Carboxypeptidase M14B n=1 Tax=Emericellopsis atlantica TaxID=2614577 RepID=A0A9P8CPP2_9HYPO|nr:uncharacterized protein F5Z01DRAFT_750091 [Emericellopsis atlantica]KAG9254758.1 hypothetical protein F5Z01DRAFT_750091 [Emericellopsis atlantica]